MTPQFQSTSSLQSLVDSPLDNDSLFSHLEAIDESIAKGAGFNAISVEDKSAVSKAVKAEMKKEMQALNFIKKKGKWVPKSDKGDSTPHHQARRPTHPTDVHAAYLPVRYSIRR
eukprot:SAG11_NODE_571_length_8451_cov_34.938218_7_plen_114_part_00